MKFAFKSWWLLFSGKIAQTKKSLVFLSVGAFLLSLANYGNCPPLIYLIAFISILFLTLFFFYALIGIQSAVATRHGCKYYGIINKKGYCNESLNYLLQNHIQNKPVSEILYIDLAEHYRRFGDYNSAINVLNSIHVPESDIALRASYIFALIRTAANKNDTILADNIWKSNQRFIDYVISENKHGENINVLHLAMIYADSIAGRYERAFKICDSFLKSEHMKKLSGFKEGFLVMKVFLLKKLEKEAEMNAAIMEFNNYVSKKWKPHFESSRAYIRLNSEKAIRGEMPV